MSFAVSVRDAVAVVEAPFPNGYNGGFFFRVVSFRLVVVLSSPSVVGWLGTGPEMVGVEVAIPDGVETCGKEEQRDEDGLVGFLF